MNRAATAFLMLLGTAATAVAQEVPVTDLSTGDDAGSGIRWTLGLGA